MFGPGQAESWAAAILSLLLPGLGHAFVGKYQAALVGSGVALGLVALGFGVTFGTGPGLVLTLGALILWELSLAVDAFRKARGRSRRLARWGAFLALAVGGNLLLSWQAPRFMANHARYRVFCCQSRAMEPDLGLGCRFLADMGSYRGRPPALRDRVVLEDPDEPGGWVVSRCVALPGDWVEIRDQGFFRNGVLQGRWTLSSEQLSLAGLETFRPLFRFGPLRVPEGHWFGLGDNRGNARDSRLWGPVPAAAEQGKVLYAFHLFDRPTGMVGTAAVLEASSLLGEAGMRARRNKKQPDYRHASA